MGIVLFPEWVLLLVVLPILLICNSIVSRLVFLSALLWFQIFNAVEWDFTIVDVPPSFFKFFFFKDLQKKNQTFLCVFTICGTTPLFFIFSPTTSKMSFLVDSGKDMDSVQKTNSKITSTPSFDTLERQAGLLIHKFLPPQSQVAIRGDWFFNLSSVFVNDHVVSYDVPEP